MDCKIENIKEAIKKLRDKNPWKKFDISGIGEPIPNDVTQYAAALRILMPKWVTHVGRDTCGLVICGHELKFNSDNFCACTSFEYFKRVDTLIEIPEDLLPIGQQIQIRHKR